jgi:ABC-type branched-subunit amino acid transport system ATPase component
VDIAGLPTYKRAKLGVGRTFQVPRLIDGATVAENIGAGLLPYDRPRLFGSLIGLPVVGREERARRDQIEEMASLVGIPSSILDDSVDMVPLGLKRIVEVARAAVARPRLLLLDEPGAGLNNEERAHLGSVLIALCKRGVTPIVVEHNVEFVMSTCEQIVLMESGKVACEFFSRRNEEIPYALDQYLRYSPL